MGRCVVCVQAVSQPPPSDTEEVAKVNAAAVAVQESAGSVIAFASSSLCPPTAQLNRAVANMCAPLHVAKLLRVAVWQPDVDPALPSSITFSSTAVDTVGDGAWDRALFACCYCNILRYVTRSTRLPVNSHRPAVVVLLFVDVQKKLVVHMCYRAWKLVCAMVVRVRMRKKKMTRVTAMWTWNPAGRWTLQSGESSSLTRCCAVVIGLFAHVV
jgi:hypothetical protein